AWIQRLDEVAGVARLPAAAAARVAAQLFFDRSAPPLDVLLESPERRQVAVRLDHLEDALSAEGADQLRLQIGLADVEAGRDPGALESPPELGLLARVA